MTTAELFDAITDAAANADFGTASAAKRGRNPEFPYVPVVNLPGLHGGAYQAQTRQIKGKAFATRMEAVAYAQRHIDLARSDLARKLADPRMRALRESYGLPREVTA